MMTNGSGGVFVRVFYKNTEYSQYISSFRYKYAEKKNDEITIDMEFTDPKMPDEDAFQEGAELQILWGWTGGLQSNPRKVYVSDPQWGFAQKLTLTLVCTEKGATLKSSSSKKVYKGKNLPRIVKEIADKHGLKPQIQLNSKDVIKLAPLPGEKLDDYNFRIESERIGKDMKQRKEEAQKNPQKAKKRFMEEMDKIDWKKLNTGQKLTQDLNSSYQVNFWNTKSGGSNNALSILSKALSRRKRTNPSTGQPVQKTELEQIVEEFPDYRNEPQANRSDLQFLSALARRHENGPFIIETRDDTITLKKRDFTATSEKTYEYRGGSGELLEFNPATKTRNRRGTSTNTGFNGWNAMNKSYFQGQVNSLMQGDPTFAAAVKLYDRLDALEKSGGGSTTMIGKNGKPMTRINPFNRVNNLFINKSNVAMGADNTLARHQPIVQVQTVTTSMYKEALGKSIENFKQRLGIPTENTVGKNIYNPRGVNPKTSFNHASNSRKNSELNANQTTATVIGNPTLEPGQVLTFTGLGKKYSGNYYIMEVEHTMDRSGYFSQLTLNRQGNNKIEKAVGGVKSRELGKPVNNSMGTNDSEKTSRRIEVRTKTNPK